VRQFLNAQRQGPIGMAEEKDANELEAEKDIALGELPPIPVQLPTSSGETRHTQREPGSWLREHGIVPPPGSFPGLDLSFGNGASRPTAPKPAASEPAREEPTGVRVVDTEERVERARAAAKRAPAKKAVAKKAPAKKAPAKRSGA
jgi:hypothetical protein